MIFEKKLYGKPLYRALIRMICIGMVLLVGFLLTVPNHLLADGAQEDWPQFHKDAANTGASSSTVPRNVTLKWRNDTISPMGGSPVVVADGKVFVIATDNKLYALDAEDGIVIWSQTIPGSLAWGSWAGPAYHNGKVFMSGNGIYCMDAANGHIDWQYIFPSGEESVDGCVTVADGKVIAGDWDGHHYYCVNEADGSHIWTYTVAGYAQGTPAYHDGNFFLTAWEYVGGHVYCVDADTGMLAWHTEGREGDDPQQWNFVWDTCGSVCVAAGKVFFTTYNFGGYGELMALNESDGSVYWGPVDIERTDSTPVYLNSCLYLCGGCLGYSGAKTYCVDAYDGAIIWETPHEDNLGDWTLSVSVADGIVLTAAPASASSGYGCDTVYALDAVTGEEIWHFEGGGNDIAIANGIVYSAGVNNVIALEEAPTHAWDVNATGDINVLDLVLVGNHFGETGTPGWIPEDVNKDGSVNVLDLIIIGNHFGE